MIPAQYPHSGNALGLRLGAERDIRKVIDGLTGDQRFFLSYAQVWRWKYREAFGRQLLQTDSHSLCEARVNAIVRNFDPWYKAFDVKPGDKLYLAPEDRVRIW